LYKSVAIDGPSGAGKSTLAKMLAQELGFLYVDTGATYRTIGLYAYRRQVGSTDKAGVVALLPEITIDLMYGEDGLQRMLLCGEDVTTDIRQHEISKYASDVSAMPEVRSFLLEMQRSFAPFASMKFPNTPLMCLPCRRCAAFCWRCNVALLKRAMLSWTGETLARWCCRRQT